MYVYPLVSGTGNLLFFGIWLHTQPIIRQLDGINTAKAAPKQIFCTVLFDIKWIYGVLDIDLVATKHLSMVGKGPLRFIGRGHSYFTCPLASPDRHRIMEHVFAIDPTYVRCPEPSLSLKGRPG